MFQILDDTQYFLCEYNFKKDCWEWIRKFKNIDSLLEYIAAAWRRGPFFEKGRLSNPIMEDLNFSGGDVFTTGGWDFYKNKYVPGEKYFRSKCILDDKGHFIDPRLFKEITIAMFEEREQYFKKHFWWRRKIPKYRFRYDPVPFVHKVSGGYCRNWKCNQHNAVLDSIPEYKKFIRKKAVPKNKWDIEPVHHFERSWKHQKKCRHQWEKNVPKHTRKYVEEERSMAEYNVTFCRYDSYTVKAENDALRRS